MTRDKSNRFTPKQKPLSGTSSTTPVLSLVDTGQMPGPALASGAYNPYDRNLKRPAPKPKAAPRPDLRKLSQWIKLKKEVDELKTQEVEPATAPGKRPLSP